MSAAEQLDHAASPLSPNGLLAYARVICELGIAAECLPPELEREFIAAVHKLTNRLNFLMGKPAYTAERADAYHRERRDNVLITMPRPKPRRDAPDVVLEAVIWSVREHGLAALKLDRNRDRISTMSPEQRAEVNRRIQSLVDKGLVKP